MIKTMKKYKKKRKKGKALMKLKVSILIYKDIKVF